MQWLIANMWMALAAATFLGLLFGFSFRGLLVGSRIRKANVEREIAKTELSQSKAEVEALYAAQRKRKEESAQAVSGDEGLQAELDEREARISSLGDELDAARAELDQLKADAVDDNGGSVVETAGAVVAGAAVGALLPDEDQEELTQLRDRNTWLEERVVTLETDLSAAVAPPGEPESKPEPAPEPTSTAENDEEMARLRWRNRYLEGRLAYFEEAAEPELVDEEAVEPAAEPESEPEAEAQPEPEPEPEPTPEPEAAPAPVAAAAEDDEEVHPSEAMLAELEGVQPEQVEQPASGGDDLTQISGIGPRIAEVLNELGIWTYAQIAGWTPENATWVENHLSFKGRVGRENWVEQAQDLVS